MLQALVDVEEHPAVCFVVDFLPEKMMSLDFLEMQFGIFNVFGQHLPIQLRTAVIKISSGQRVCGVQVCGLFH
jgi:hypothetical protein